MRVLTWSVRIAAGSLVALVALLVFTCARAQSPCPATPPPPGCPTTPSGANSVQLCWAHDGKATDGAAIALTGFKAYFGLNGALTNSQSFAGGTTRNGLLTGLAPGLYTLSVSALAGTVESDKSCTVTKLVAGASPNPPTGVQPVTLAGPVFIFGITNDSLVRLEAGSVVAGRPCDPTQQIAYAGASYMRVNAALVAPFPGQQVLAGFATCR